MKSLSLDSGNGTVSACTSFSASQEVQAVITGSGIVYREHAEQLRDWLNEFLEETRIKLPKGIGSIIEITAYGAPVQLVRTGKWWHDDDGNGYSDQEIGKFTVVRDGL